MKEIWKDIEGYEGYYQISTFGRCKSLSRVIIRDNGRPYSSKEILLEPFKHKGGYLKFRLTINKISKDYFAHRLVASAFIANENKYPHVLHKVESIPINNNVDNLWWGTAEMNMQDMVSKGRNNPRVGSKNGNYGKYGSDGTNTRICLNLETGIFYGSIIEAAASINMHKNTLQSMLKGKNPNKTSFIYA